MGKGGFVPGFHRCTRIEAPADEVEAWHGRPGADVRLIPPWLLRSGLWRWLEHDRIVESHGAEACILADDVSWALPLDRVSRLAEPWMRKELERVFRFRHRRVADDVERHRGLETMRFGVTGSRGLVGSHLVPFLLAGGHEVERIGRELMAPDGLDAVVHLAGEPFQGGPWTPARRERIVQSRVSGTRALCERLAALEKPPRVLISASTAAVYGHRGDEVLDELAPTGMGFLPDLGRAWEAATQPARDAGIRVVHLRLGVVLSARGGVLPALAAPFKWFVGGAWGRADGWMPWIALDDVLGAILHAAVSPTLEGPVNVVSPNPLRLLSLAKHLGAVLRRPAWVHVPAHFVHAALGDLARALLVDSRHVVPRRLIESGFRFRWADASEALRYELGRTIVRTG
jgi:uncharacterized protein (TIGR01777 family)